MKTLAVLATLLGLLTGLLSSAIDDTRVPIAGAGVLDHTVASSTDVADGGSPNNCAGVATDGGNLPIPGLDSSLGGEWVGKADTPDFGGFGEAVVSVGNSVYIARCDDASSIPQFWHYDSAADGWNSLGTSELPTGAFRNGTALTGDESNYIYALLGGRYRDSNRRLFYRYGISGNGWEQLADTPHAQCAGNAITWSGYDNHVYALMGSKEHGTAFARYSYDSWEMLPFNPTWTRTDDGCSLVYTGGEYLYALRGEWEETVPNGDFARYHIPTQSWQNMTPMPESDGVGDGGSLLWGGSCFSKYSDYIFALGGGAADEEPGYNFYRYSISSNAWDELEAIPCPVGHYVGNRLGCDSKHIYYWQGAPSNWDCGGDAFHVFAEDNPDVAEGLESILDKLVMAYAYKAAEGVGGWTVYNPEWAVTHPEWNSLTTLYVQRGYWINVSGGCDLTYEANTYELDEGWNLIGWVGC